jgi:hypothetical protein
MSEDYAAAASGSVRDAGSDNPGQLVADSVAACLDIARTWHAWDGRPVARTATMWTIQPGGAITAKL